MTQKNKATSVALPKPPTKAVSKLDAKPTVTAKPTVIKTKTAVKKPNRVEVWMYDEYDQGNIIFSTPDIAAALAKAKGYVSELNVENALAASEKNKQWEAYFLELFNGKKPVTDVVYAGNKKDGRHYVYALQENGEWKLQPLAKDAKFKFYLGELNRGRVKEPWYLADHKGTEIVSLSAQEIERKTVVFIKVL